MEKTDIDDYLLQVDQNERIERSIAEAEEERITLLRKIKRVKRIRKSEHLKPQHHGRE
jgi:hypothetical protein